MGLWFVFSLTHSFPLIADVLRGEVGVGVDSRQLDSVGLSDLQDLVVDAQCGHTFLVSFGQSGLELVVSSDQTLQGTQRRVLEPDRTARATSVGASFW